MKVKLRWIEAYLMLCIVEQYANDSTDRIVHELYSHLSEQILKQTKEN